jgi:hypothetical protein
MTPVDAIQTTIKVEDGLCSTARKSGDGYLDCPVEGNGFIDWKESSGCA